MYYYTSCTQVLFRINTNVLRAILSKYYLASSNGTDMHIAIIKELEIFKYEMPNIFLAKVLPTL